MLHCGDSLFNGVPLRVERKSIRRINLRVRPDGGVSLSIPLRWATLNEGETFLLSKWSWVLETRARILAQPKPVVTPITSAERAQLIATLYDLHLIWATRLHENNVSWKLRDMKTLWGSCHIRKRVITYNLRLARATREQIEYVVVHELTHLVAPNHGPLFHRLMNERLPGWPILRRQLNKR